MLTANKIISQRLSKLLYEIDLIKRINQPKQVFQLFKLIHLTEI